MKQLLLVQFENICNICLVIFSKVIYEGTLNENIRSRLKLMGTEYKKERRWTKITETAYLIGIDACVKHKQTKYNVLL